MTLNAPQHHAQHVNPYDDNLAYKCTRLWRTDRRHRLRPLLAKSTIQLSPAPRHHRRAIAREGPAATRKTRPAGPPRWPVAASETDASLAAMSARSSPPSACTSALVATLSCTRSTMTEATRSALARSMPASSMAFASGALTTAVDTFLEPAGYLSLATNHALRSILDRKLIVAQASARKLANTFGHDVAKHAGYQKALTETAIVMNAALTAHAVQQELRGFDPHELRTVYGVYLLESHEIWAPTRSSATASGLAEPPIDLASFIELNDGVTDSFRLPSRAVFLRSPG